MSQNAIFGYQFVQQSGKRGKSIGRGDFAATQYLK